MVKDYSLREHAECLVAFTLRIATTEIAVVLIQHYPVLTMAYILLDPGVMLVSRATGNPFQLGRPQLAVVHVGCDPMGCTGSTAQAL